MLSFQPLHVVHLIPVLTVASVGFSEQQFLAEELRGRTKPARNTAAHSSDPWYHLALSRLCQSTLARAVHRSQRQLLVNFIFETKQVAPDPTSHRY